MKRGDLARGWDGWLARVKGFGKHNTVQVVWETGALKGRPALVIKEGLRVVAKGATE
jgi:hypothetical protein